MNFIRTFVLCSLDIALVIVDKGEADVRFAMVEVLVLFLVLVFRKVYVKTESPGRQKPYRHKLDSKFSYNRHLHRDVFFESGICTNAELVYNQGLRTQNLSTD